MALAEDGQLDKAIELLTKLREKTPELKRQQIDRRLAIFRAGKTYRQAEAEKSSSPAAGGDAQANAGRSEALAWYQQAVALEQAGHLAEAAVSFEKAVARAAEVLGPDHQDLGLLLVRSGDVYLHLKQPKQAAPRYMQALAVLRRHLPREDANVTYAVNNLAAAFSGHGRR